MNVCMCVRMYVYMYACMYVCVCVCVCLCVSAYKCVDESVAGPRVGLPDTGPPSLVFGPPSLLAHQVFWPSHFFLFGPPNFLRAKNLLIIHIFEYKNC